MCVYMCDWLKGCGEEEEEGGGGEEEVDRSERN